jgi:UDP-N-acetylmuramoyl-L-alanyl-D-glutamate--2,6-diaminopimelate ligase
VVARGLATDDVRQPPIGVFVDYSHTPDSIAKAIEALDAVKPARTIIVFGCGGDRDAAKRPLMGAAALAADYAVVTSDNPRSEDPLAIIDDILPGMEQGAGRFEVEPDRRAAIARALALAEPGDFVLIAGKGHEDYQLVADKVLDFDDRLVAAEELRALVDARAFEAATAPGPGAASAPEPEPASEAAATPAPEPAAAPAHVLPTFSKDTQGEKGGASCG